jgi:ParB family transcriptional regulator, chromosome partitioning protein
VPKARGLGRGLSELIPESVAAPGERIEELPLGAVRPNPHQPRRRFDPERLAELAASVREHGVLEPIVVRRARGDGYEIVAGERRWRAAAIAGQERVPVVVRDVSDERMLEIALVENLQREDLGLWEEASALRALMQTYGWTQEQVAERVAKSRSHVANTLRVLALPEGARTLVEEGRLSLGHVKAILEAPPERIETLARTAADGGLTVREVGARVAALGRRSERRGGRPASARSAWPPDLQARAASVGARLGRPLRWRASGEGGEVALECGSAKEAAHLLWALERALMFLEEQSGRVGSDVPRGTSIGEGAP